MIPEILEDWNYKVVDDLVKKNMESDRHDFKSCLPDPETLTKICCAFANTKGGFIVLGVEESHSTFRIKGIDNDKELAHKFGQKINNAQPTIDFDFPKIIDIPNSGNKVLAVFHIGLSDERPHIPSHIDKRTFWKRTNEGTTQMTYEEIRMSFQRYEERREKIKLLYIELLSNIETLNEMKSHSTINISEDYSLFTLDSSIITSLLTDLYSIIGKDSELIKHLFTIKQNIQIINTNTRIFHSRISIPIGDVSPIVKEHNEFIIERVDCLIPIVEKAKDILEKRFNLRNPLNA